MWFKKKEKELVNTVDKLDKTIKDLNKQICDDNYRLKQEIEKLHRIIKYAGDEPTFHLAKYSSFLGRCTGYTNKHVLHLYIDKEEYIVELTELKDCNVIDQSCEFKVDGDLAYFNVSVTNGFWKRYEYVIDYKKETYFCNIREDENDALVTDDAIVS